MVTKYITKDTNEAIVAPVSRTRWVVNEGVAVNVQGKDGFSNPGHFDNDLTVKGSISVISAGSHAAVHLFSARDSVTVAETGFLHGPYGVKLDFRGQAMENFGTIEGTIRGLQVNGDQAVIKNHGTIRSSESTAVDIDGESASVTNFEGGVLRGVSGGDYIDKGMTLENFGTIKPGDVSGWAIYMRSGDNHLINHGKITGGISFGHGDDTVDLREGTFSSFVTGGKGNDVYLFSSKDPLVMEYDNEGIDTLKVSATYALDQQQEIENFYLVGNKDINATGSDCNNLIVGNKGANKIFGMEGNDTLDGGTGSDKLYGGADFDTFVFNEGNGQDYIMDFALSGFEADIIDLSGHDVYNTIAEIKAHAHQNGAGHAVINFGDGDTLTLKSIDYHDLKTANFDFG